MLTVGMIVGCTRPDRFSDTLVQCQPGSRRLSDPAKRENKHDPQHDGTRRRPYSGLA
jgi:hypothetical protein